MKKKCDLFLMTLVFLTVSILLITGCTTGKPGKKVETDGIHKRAAIGDIEGIKKFISKGVSINEAEPQFGHTPLMRAAINNQFAVIDFLLKNGADINATDKGGMTALAWSVNMEKFESFEFLLNKGAVFDTQDNLFGKTPLMNAMAASNPEFAIRLIGKGADVNIQSDDGSTPLLYAVSELNGNRDNTKIMELLIKKGANVNKENNKGLTPLIYLSGPCLFSSLRIQ